jgi:hypothetical protein
MHFTRAGYVLVERLIENMILFGAKNRKGLAWAIDPSRVYLIGVSAGADGVFRLSNRLAQRFAAVSAAGGDPGSLNSDNNMTNLMNVPICLQVGEQDSASFQRNKHVAESGVKLDDLRREYSSLVKDNLDPRVPDIYRHEVFIHPRVPEPLNLKGDTEKLYLHRHFMWESKHFSWSGGPDTARPQSSVITGYSQWLKEWDNNNDKGFLSPSPKTIIEIDAPVRKDGQKDVGRVKSLQFTNAIDWVTKQKPRYSVPLDLAWDLRYENHNDSFGVESFRDISGRAQETRIGKGERSQHYWLDVGQYDYKDVGPIIKVRIDRNLSRITVYEAKRYLRILLRPGMVANDNKIVLQTPQSKRGFVVPVNWNNPAVIVDTLGRNDPNLIFTADIILEQDAIGKWTVSSTPNPGPTFEIFEFAAKAAKL